MTQSSSGPRPRNYGGMGLGPYISRYRAEAHGGSLRVVETEGTGSTFALTIPRFPAEPLSDSPAPAGGTAARTGRWPG